LLDEEILKMKTLSKRHYYFALVFKASTILSLPSRNNGRKRLFINIQPSIDGTGRSFATARLYTLICGPIYIEQ